MYSKFCPPYLDGKPRACRFLHGIPWDCLLAGRSKQDLKAPCRLHRVHRNSWFTFPAPVNNQTSPLQNFRIALPVVVRSVSILQLMILKPWETLIGAACPKLPRQLQDQKDLEPLTGKGENTAPLHQSTWQIFVCPSNPFLSRRDWQGIWRRRRGGQEGRRTRAVVLKSRDPHPAGGGNRICGTQNVASC